MHQIVYVSTSRIGLFRRKLELILDQSVRYNSAHDITGLLWTDGKRFAQVLEGSEPALAALMKRIRADPRHCNIVVLTEGPIARREFGDWSMALRDAAGANIPFNARVRAGLAGAPADVRDAFPELGGDS